MVRVRMEFCTAPPDDQQVQGFITLSEAVLLPLRHPLLRLHNAQNASSGFARYALTCFEQLIVIEPPQGRTREGAAASIAKGVLGASAPIIHSYKKREFLPVLPPAELEDLPCRLLPDSPHRNQFL
jgi:hypothetical protein